MNVVARIALPATATLLLSALCAAAQPAVAPAGARAAPTDTSSTAGAPATNAATNATHYKLDAAKSSLEFGFVQAGAQNKGHFRSFPVSMDFSPDNPAAGKLDVTVEMNSLDTGDKERDDTLRGADLFAVAKYPQAHFTAAQITKTPTGFLANGSLTLRGVTRPLAVPFTFRTATEAGAAAGYMNGKVTLHRLDFGVGQGDWKSTEWVGNDVTVNFALRLVK
ncbi:MAG: YceI family protein [Proteobacteria bacterium]|nr:YceI family protein [Pseudomonadota bacterium]